MEKAGGREEDGVTWRERDLEKVILGSKEVRWKWFGRDVAWSAGWDVGRSMGWGAGWGAEKNAGRDTRLRNTEG